MDLAGKIVPFGKYKGKPIEAMVLDEAYCDWLAGQDWFRERYSTIFNIIVNNFGEPPETPEHNALQARFLNDDYRREFSISAQKPKPFVDVSSYFKRKKEDKWHRGLYVDEESPEFIVKAEWRKRETKAVFEEDGFDCSIYCIDTYVSDPVAIPSEWEKLYSFFSGQAINNAVRTEERFRISVEIKPSLADDFPAVLRQINAARRRVLQTEARECRGGRWFVRSRGGTLLRCGRVARRSEKHLEGEQHQAADVAAI